MKAVTSAIIRFKRMFCVVVAHSTLVVNAANVSGVFLMPSISIWCKLGANI